MRRHNCSAKQAVAAYMRLYAGRNAGSYAQVGAMLDVWDNTALGATTREDVMVFYCDLESALQLLSRAERTVAVCDAVGVRRDRLAAELGISERTLTRWSQDVWRRLDAVLTARGIIV